MKFVIEIELDYFGAIATLVESQRKVARHSKKIWASKKSRKELQRLFSEDFDEFVRFVCAADSLSKAMQYIATIRLDQQSQKK